MAKKKLNGAGEIVSFNDKKVDFRRSFPMTIGDWETLEELGCVKGGDLVVATTKQSIDLMLYLAVKANPDVTREDVRAVPIADLAGITEVMKTLMEDSENAIIKGESPT